MLKVNELTIRAGTFQANRISFEVPEGSCHVLLGPTGSGKTLVLESVAGLHRPLWGRILLAGQEISGMPPEKRKIAYLPQDLALFPGMAVKDNIAYSLRFNRAGKERRHDRIRDLAKSLGIPGILNRSIHHLSGGEKQRVALARALASGSRMMLLDEPLSSLHVNLRREIWYLLKKIQKEHKITLLMVTHDLDEALFLGNTISILNEGRLLQSGLKNDVFKYPRSQEAARIVGVENYFPAIVRKTGEKDLLLHCPEMKTDFQVQARDAYENFQVNEPVIMGIRSDSLTMANSLEQLGKTNVSRFLVEEVNEKGSSATVLLRHPNNGDLLALAEINRNGAIPTPGQAARILFPSDRVMVFSADHG